MFNSIHQNFQFSTPFLKGYKELKIPILDTKGNPTWPDVFPLEKVRQLRETVGDRHFSSQMLLEYISEDKARLDPGALVFYDSFFDAHSAKLGDNKVTSASLYWDPSGGRIKSDSSVCVLLYKDDRNRRAFIHDILYLRVDEGDMHPLATQCARVLDFMRTHNQKNIAIEVNGIGNALPEILRELAVKRGQSAIVQKIVNHQSKEIRILDAIEPLLSTGRLFAHDRIKSSPLLSEMLGWSPIATCNRDDGLDAVAGALRMRSTPVRQVSQSLRPIKANTEFLV